MADHLPNGALEVAWNACEDGATLVWIYARTGDRDGLIDALGPCVEWVLGLVSPPHPIPLNALEAARAFRRREGLDAGALAIEAATEATLFTEEIAATADGEDPVAGVAMAASEAAAAIARIADPAASADDLSAWAHHCLTCAASALAGQVDDRHPERQRSALRDLASRCRGVLRCPPLASVLGGGPQS